MMPSVGKRAFEGRSVEKWEVWVKADEVIVDEAGDEVFRWVMILDDSLLRHYLPLMESNVARR